MLAKKVNIDIRREYAISIEQSSLHKRIKEVKLYIYFKSILDIIVAIVGLFLCLPALLFFIIAIKLETPGPAFFYQQRVGMNGKTFNVIKLRSMCVEAEKNGAQWAKKNDPRVTKVGTFIRKTRIDEIPQLINVLRGEMSIIGPRPERPMFTAQFNEEFPGFTNRLLVKPGLTGWAQVNGGYDITPREKLNLDLYYIRELSLMLELKIIFMTMKVVLTGEGAR
ncbi:exopolysaccharide biosynthesis polyprenyl glycosylphosphotransferase [Paenibacillus sp. GCM10023248]|uniref:exopolysaccharide biosynthesis polyprenyl glycosylphosphotransferase n=1 Tax=unclassified Paenibacillus TaxID=185978 RepID=UPI002378631F|nr:exopolysaccharide biosynthesis polyprenyl glycosylphosphotransferase [Paenibacillus sp. MAHUQ-63]MDD9266227.1 exopolysaccharide biosynthesis polyprenyl glycosylphosphotransferase [Paenibacillus sp. MAHUQ-63]